MLVHHNVAKLGALLIMIFAISVGIWMFTASYFGIEILPSLSFYADDGHCIPSSQGVGSHCFGDYYYPLNIAKQQSPWHGYNPYPAAPMSIFKFFVALEGVTNSPRFSLLIYFVLSTVAITAPSIWVLKRMGPQYGAVIFILSGPFSYAGMIALDRGNLIGLITPLLLLYLVGLRNSNFNYIHIGIIGSAIIKPQFAILAVIFLLINRYRSFLVSIWMIALTQLLPFLLWPSDYINNITMSLKMMLQFNSIDESESMYPTQISITMPFRIIGFFLKEISIVPSSELNIMPFVKSYGGASLLVFVLSILYIYRKNFSMTVMGAYIIVVLTLLSGTVYNYYLLIAGPIIGICIISLNENKYKIDNQINLQQYKTLTICTGLSLVAFPLPLVIEGKNLVATTLSFTPFLWLFAVFAGLIQGIRQSTQG